MIGDDAAHPAACAAGAGEVMNLGRHAAAWRDFCELTGIEFVQV
jgi:hypothetical protein